MTMQEFVERYSGKDNLYDISWEDFPDELHIACEQFVEGWFANTDINDLREISGFNDMSVDDLLRYTQGRLPDDAQPLGEPYKRVCGEGGVIVNACTEVFSGSDTT
jgi:hypothetical protein